MLQYWHNKIIVFVSIELSISWCCQYISASLLCHQLCLGKKIIIIRNGVTPPPLHVFVHILAQGIQLELSKYRAPFYPVFGQAFSLICKSNKWMDYSARRCVELFVSFLTIYSNHKNSCCWDISHILLIRLWLTLATLQFIKNRITQEMTPEFCNSIIVLILAF